MFANHWVVTMGTVQHSASPPVERICAVRALSFGSSNLSGLSHRKWNRNNVLRCSMLTSTGKKLPGWSNEYLSSSWSDQCQTSMSKSTWSEDRWWLPLSLVWETPIDDDEWFLRRCRLHKGSLVHSDSDNTDKTSKLGQHRETALRRRVSKTRTECTWS